MDTTGHWPHLVGLYQFAPALPSFIPEIRLQRAVSSGIKWILTMACVIAGSSRQTKFTTEPSDVELISRWRRMKKINWH